VAIEIGRRSMRPAAGKLLLLLTLNICIEMIDYVVYVSLKASGEDEGYLRVLLAHDIEINFINLSLSTFPNKTTLNIHLFSCLK
jgi:hypothetical protein